ncbi:MAG: carbohydrate ABC transporter permease [Hungatella sp.]|jgi:sn-glycerol 3-phosphate transport system permease protein|nr:carbohydrate ABC transporter permease [Hungatella sp.]
MYKLSQKVWAVAGTILKAILIFVFVFPFLWMVSVSLQTDMEISSSPITLIPAVPQWINFAAAWSKGPFLLYLKNSLTIIVSVIAMQMVIMVPAAYAFAKCDFKGKNLMFGLVLIAFMTPGQITFLPIYQMMSEWEVMDTLLPQIVPFMTNAFGIFLLRQYFMQVPDELIEAAKLDNAGSLKIVYKLMLPMAKPAMSTVVLFSFVSHWNDYFWPLVMTQTTNVRTLPIGIAMLKNTEGITNWNIIMAGNMILVMPILVVYVFCSKSIIRSFAYSGIK